MPEGHHVKRSLNQARDEDLDELNKSTKKEEITFWTVTQWLFQAIFPQRDQAITQGPAGAPTYSLSIPTPKADPIV